MTVGLLLGLLTAGSSAALAQQIDGAQARPAPVADKGAAAQPSARLERMLILLDAGAGKRQALDTLLNAQQTHGDANYHKWLTAQQYADRFAVSAAEAAKVTAWLRQQGFAVAALPASREWVEFSGTLAQVQKAFGTRVKSLPDETAGTARYRFAAQPKIPAAIAGLIHGFVSLDGTLASAAATRTVVIDASANQLAANSVLDQGHALTPSRASDWLGFAASPTKGGAGEVIAIPSRSSVRAEDFAAFRKSFGLPEAALEIQEDTAGIAERNGDEAATIQAASWAGAAAPEARIVVVPVASTNATDGLDLALAATVDGRLANTVSVGYSACERAVGATHAEFYETLYRLAAAQGISVIAATGDSGAAACHIAGDATPVSTGRDVNALASTPWNTAVGAVAFGASRESVMGWEQSSYATGGGASRLYKTPEWQSAAGIPASDPDTSSEHHRYLPDLSLPTAEASSGMAFCYSGSNAANGCHLLQGGGSSVAAAMLAGISARLAEKYGAQGNLAPNLYAVRRAELSANSTAKTVFSDVTTGSAKLACVTGSPDCGDAEAGEIGFTAAAGYDMVSGLGTIHAQMLVDNWATPQATGTANVTVEMTSIGGITYNPSATIVLSAKVLSGSGGSVPTGTVQFYDQTTSGNTGTPVTLAADGTASYSESGQFTNGGHNIAAIYSGDSTYKSATSQTVTIDIQPSATSLLVTPSTVAPAGGSTITVTGTVSSTNPGSSAPTGTLTVNLDGIAQGNATLTTTGTVTTGSVSVVVPTAGSHAVQGTYSGDANYNNSTSPSVTITVAKSATVTSISATPSVLTTGVPETFTATIAPLSAVAGDVFTITGTVSFFDSGTTLLGTAPISSNTAILAGISLSNSAAHTVTAVYSGDATYTTSVSSPLLLSPTLLPVTVTLTSNGTIWTPDSPVNLTATVSPVTTPPSTSEQNPSGYVLFYAGTILISGQVPVLQGPGNTGVASTSVPHLPAGQYVVTARYFGDPTYGPAISNSLNLQVEDFTVVSGTTSIDVIQGQTGQAVFTVSSLGGLTGPIQLQCEEQNPPQTGAITCTFSPSIIDGSGNATLTVVTSSGAVARNEEKRSPFPPLAGGGVVLALLGLMLPVGKRARSLRVRLPMLALLLAGIVGAGAGCNNTVTLNTTRATPLGVHTLKITAAAYVNKVTVSHYAYLTVNVKP